MMIAPLICIDGKWTYTEGDDTTEITEVSCLLQVIPPPCATCTVDQITFTEATGAGTSTPFSRDLITNGDDCLEITLVCTPNTPTGTVFMRFNGELGGPLDVGVVEVTAKLTCVDGQWIYSQGGVDTPITEVNCLAT